jgi:hypothetical protein
VGQDTSGPDDDSSCGKTEVIIIRKRSKKRGQKGSPIKRPLAKEQISPLKKKLHFFLARVNISIFPLVCDLRFFFAPVISLALCQQFLHCTSHPSGSRLIVLKEGCATESLNSFVYPPLLSTCYGREKEGEGIKPSSWLNDITS